MAAKQITIYDSETDIAVDVTVSVEDARRAENDLLFAMALMNGALGKMAATNMISQHTATSQHAAMQSAHQGDAASSDEGDATSSDEGDATSSDEGDATSSEERDLFSIEKNKESVASYLKKRLRQKSEEEVARAKRHKEHMEIKKEILTLLTKLVDKK